MTCRSKPSLHRRPNKRLKSARRLSVHHVAAPCGLGACRVRPAWALAWGCEFPGDLVAGIQAKRKASIVRSGSEEAWSESAG